MAVATPNRLLLKEDKFSVIRGLWSEVLKTRHYQRRPNVGRPELFLLIEENDTGLVFVEPRFFPLLTVVTESATPTDYEALPVSFLPRGRMLHWGVVLVMVVAAAGVAYYFIRGRLWIEGDAVAAADDDAGDSPPRSGGGLRDALADVAGEEGCGNNARPPRIVLRRRLAANPLGLGLPDARGDAAAVAAYGARGPPPRSGGGLRDSLADVAVKPGGGGGGNIARPPHIIVLRRLAANRLGLDLPAADAKIPDPRTPQEGIRQNASPKSNDNLIYMKALYHALPMDYVHITKLQGNRRLGKAVIRFETTNRKLLEMNKILKDIAEQMAIDTNTGLGELDYDHFVTHHGMKEGSTVSCFDSVGSDLTRTQELSQLLQSVSMLSTEKAPGRIPISMHEPAMPLENGVVGQRIRKSVTGAKDKLSRKEL